MAAKRKRVTLNEFQAWLDGVEELQPDGWTPSAAQWKLIRDKISNIKEAPVVAQQPVINTPAPHMQQGIPQAPAPGYVPAPDVGGVPLGSVEMSPAASAMMNPGHSNKTVTPNIDTTNGNYASSFE